MSDHYISMDEDGASLRRLPNYPLVTQTAHGFAVGTLIFNNGSTWVRADALSEGFLASHIVAKAIDANAFSPVSYDPHLQINSHGITPGTKVYLSNSSGLISGTQGTVKQVIGHAIDGNYISVNITSNAIDESRISKKVTNGGDGETVTVGTGNANDLVLILNQVEKFRLRHNTGLIELPGLTESVNATGLLAVNPSDGSLYVKPEYKTIYVLDSDLPIATWVNATTVSVGSGRAICKDSADLTSERLWRHPVGVSAITATLPAITPGVTAYLYLAANDAGDATAFISTANPPNNNPVGFNWVRLLTAFVANGSAQLNQFVMDGERWVTGNFASETFIAGASWASKIIPGCPLGSVEVYGIASAGHAVPNGVYSIRISLANPTTASVVAPSSSGYWVGSFDGNLASFNGSDITDIRVNTDNFFGVAENAGLWNIKTGSAYLNADTYPTVRLLKYRSVLKVLS